MGAPEDGTAPHGVVHGGGDVGLVGVDGVVARKPADVRVDVPGLLAVELPVVEQRGRRFGLHPVALFEAQDSDAGGRDTPGEGGTGGPGSDYDNVNGISSGQRVLPVCASPPHPSYPTTVAGIPPDPVGLPPPSTTT